MAEFDIEITITRNGVNYYADVLASGLASDAAYAASTEIMDVARREGWDHDNE